MSHSRDKAIEQGKIAPDRWDATYEARARDAFGVDEEESMSLFDINMPGVLTRAQVENEVDLDNWNLWVPPMEAFPMGILVRVSVSGVLSLPPLFIYFFFFLYFFLLFHILFVKRDHELLNIQPFLFATGYRGLGPCQNRSAGHYHGHCGRVGCCAGQGIRRTLRRCPPYRHLIE